MEEARQQKKMLVKSWPNYLKSWPPYVDWPQDAQDKSARPMIRYHGKTTSGNQNYLWHCTYVRTYLRKHVRTYARTYVRVCVRACVSACVRAYVRACCVCAVCVHACVRAYVRMYVRTHDNTTSSDGIMHPSKANSNLHA